ncbi:50S ribosomal protein L15 [Candidatus Peregrinibacteria bacterium]|nr:MAG: 50S ribosomal protein L15 [Candidatus Peregrinibacteria bacterium]
MQLNSIKPKQGSIHSKKRLGRGNGSGHGTFSGRGCKGQGQRKSGNVRPGFEGGQTPIISRLPKLRGFKNPNRAEFQVLNVADLNRFKDGEEVNMITLLERKLIRKKAEPVKILGHGIIERKLTVKIHKVSKTAREKIVAAGGSVL